MISDVRANFLQFNANANDREPRLSHAMQDEHGIMTRAIPFSGLRTTLFVVKGNKMSLEMAQLRMDHPCRQDGEKKFNQLKELLLNFFISELTE